MSNHKVILLVEDNPNDEALTCLALRKSNVMNEIVVAQDGAEALDYLYGPSRHVAANHMDLPTLVLLDLSLRKVDGLEVLRRIRADDRTRRLPVIVLASSKEEQEAVESYDLGANRYLRKPIRFDEFIEAARQLGLYWLLLDERPSR